MKELDLAELGHVSWLAVLHSMYGQSLYILPYNSIEAY